MNSIVTTTERNSLTLTEAETLAVMENSLYPGARPESIKMALAYCTARGLDPFQKPVHLVPMSVKNVVKDKYEWRDVVMPGIGLYRIQASRSSSGQHVGTDEPVFGPMVEDTLGGVKVTYPEWCSVTVRKHINGAVALFTAKEFWLENYATAGKDTTKPNTMWLKRSRGQLAKCAEAQALRKAFPDVGDSPTAEEMEGKGYDYDLSPDGKGGTPTTAGVTESLTPTRKAPPPANVSDAKIATPPPPAAPAHAPAPAATTEGQGDLLGGAPAGAASDDDGIDDGELASMGHKSHLERRATAAGKDLAVVYEQLGFKAEALTLRQWEAVKRHLSA
jgi:phage recombination protein Bet